jgi:hypothetical protein
MRARMAELVRVWLPLPIGIRLALYRWLTK